MYRILHLTASPFLGGPERQLLGLSRALSDRCETVCASFAEGGSARPFLDAASNAGLISIELVSNYPHYFAVQSELTQLIRSNRTQVLFTHGYKGNIFGVIAAKRLGIPVVSVSRGWTGHTWKVRMNERLDRLALRYADVVVGVSKAQSEKIRHSGVPPAKILTIQNAIDRSRFGNHDPAGRVALTGLVAAPVRHIVGFAGRLSPEKGPDIFVRAAIETLRKRSDVGFVLFGDGPMKADMLALITQADATDHISLVGFQPNLDRLMPNLDVLALTSYTEGLPNAILEAMAAGVPVVATSVGGVPEAISDHENGLLVAPGNPTAVFKGIDKLLSDTSFRSKLVSAGLSRVEREFTFEAQALRYEGLIRDLAGSA